MEYKQFLRDVATNSKHQLIEDGKFQFVWNRESIKFIEEVLAQKEFKQEKIRIFTEESSLISIQKEPTEQFLTQEQKKEIIQKQIWNQYVPKIKKPVQDDSNVEITNITTVDEAFNQSQSSFMEMAEKSNQNFVLNYNVLNESNLEQKNEQKQVVLPQMNDKDEQIIKVIKLPPLSQKNKKKKKQDKKKKIQSIDQIQQVQEAPYKEIQVKQLSNQIQEVRTLKWQLLNLPGQKPVNRFGAQACRINQDIFLFGGQAHVRQNYIWTINLIDQEWSQLVEGPPMKYGSTVTIFKDKIVIYGGVNKRRTNYKEKHFYPYLCKMNLNDTQWDSSTLNLEARAFQSSCIIGNWLIISGGRGKSGKFLDDSWAINLDNNEEIKIDLQLSPIIQHSITPVFQDSILYNYWLDLNNIQHLPCEGFYIFGGMDQNGNFLSCLKLVSPQNWKCKILSNEQIPARSSHLSFIYQQQLWIYGGQSKQNNEIQPLSDCYSWNLENQQWSHILIPDIKPRRSPFGVVVQNQFILFSQENDNEELLMVDLDSQFN